MRVTGLRCEEDESIDVVKYTVYVEVEGVTVQEALEIDEDRVHWLAREVGRMLVGNPISCFSDAGRALLEAELMPPTVSSGERLTVLGIAQRRLVRLVVRLLFE